MFFDNRWDSPLGLTHYAKCNIPVMVRDFHGGRYSKTEIVDFNAFWSSFTDDWEEAVNAVWGPKEKVCKKPKSKPPTNRSSRSSS